MESFWDFWIVFYRKQYILLFRDDLHFLRKYLIYLLQAREIRSVGPTVEISEYHWFHREKVELFMAELYNKVGKNYCKQTAGNLVNNTYLFDRNGPNDLVTNKFWNEHGRQGRKYINFWEIINQGTALSDELFGKKKKNYRVQYHVHHYVL